jgi:hypothetical protein
VISPPPQQSVQLLPSGRVAGSLPCLAVLSQEEPALVSGQLVQASLRVERVPAYRINRLRAHSAVLASDPAENGNVLTQGSSAPRRPGGVCPMFPAHTPTWRRAVSGDLPQDVHGHPGVHPGQAGVPLVSSRMAGAGDPGETMAQFVCSLRLARRTVL